MVCIDGMGNPHRTKAFHDAFASKPEDMGDDTIPDQVSGIKELAAFESQLDKVYPTDVVAGRSNAMAPTAR